MTNYVELVLTVELPADTFPMLTYALPEDAFLADLNAGDRNRCPFANPSPTRAPRPDAEHQTMTFMGAYFRTGRA